VTWWVVWTSKSMNNLWKILSDFLRCLKLRNGHYFEEGIIFSMKILWQKVMCSNNPIPREKWPLLECVVF
jgi:hypothetical protein